MQSPSTAPSRTAPLYIYMAAAIYAAIVGITVHLHEPWADEAQAWLLARDAGLFELWTRLLHYEGTPGVWHTLLHALIQFGLPYSGLNVVSELLGFAAAFLVFKYAPLPIGFRLLLPFTYFICYQYTVIARSYSLLPILVFGAAILYIHGVSRIFPLTLLLSLLAGVSVQGFALSISIWTAFHLRILRSWAGLTNPDRKRLLAAAGIYAAALITFVISAWPAKDVTFPFHIDPTLNRWLYIPVFLSQEAFAGQWILSSAIVALSIPLLWKGGGLLVFVLSAVLVWAVSAAVYVHHWHVGILFLAWLFAVWISARNSKLDLAAKGALAAVVITQCYWTFQSVRYDWGHPYSGSLEAASFIRDNGLSGRRIYVVGYSSTAIQPYFSTNLFSNLNGGGKQAYWDWSSRNSTTDPAAFVGAGNPDYVVVGFKDASEREPWANLMKLTAYKLEKTFDGHLFWRTQVLEPEAFDLYSRGSSSAPTGGASVVGMAEARTAAQLIAGFYGVESNAWRWTARQFVVMLSPPGGRTVLKLNLAIPPVQIQNLGPMTLSAVIDGHLLAPETYSQAGSFVYSREIPADALREVLVPVTFTFDKAARPSAADARNLAAIVSSVGLYPAQP